MKNLEKETTGIINEMKVNLHMNKKSSFETIEAIEAKIKGVIVEHSNSEVELSPLAKEAIEAQRKLENKAEEQRINYTYAVMSREALRKGSGNLELF